jgi:hypothetical protein
MNINEIKEEEIMDKIEDLKNVVLTSEEQFNRCLPISTTMSYKELKPYIVIAQEVNLLPCIGYNDLRCIQYDITNNCVSDKDKQMISCVSACLTHYAIYHAIPKYFSRMDVVNYSRNSPWLKEDLVGSINSRYIFRSIIKEQADFLLELFVKLDNITAKNYGNHDLKQLLSVDAALLEQNEYPIYKYIPMPDNPKFIKELTESIDDVFRAKLEKQNKDI